jgi:hypothetical protein
VHAGYHFTSDKKMRMEAGLERLTRVVEYAEKKHALIKRAARGRRGSCLWTRACGPVPVDPCLWTRACGPVPVDPCLWTHRGERHGEPLTVPPGADRALRPSPRSVHGAGEGFEAVPPSPALRERQPARRARTTLGENLASVGGGRAGQLRATRK